MSLLTSGTEAHAPSAHVAIHRSHDPIAISASDLWKGACDLLVILSSVNESLSSQFPAREPHGGEKVPVSEAALRSNCQTNLVFLNS